MEGLTTARCWISFSLLVLGFLWTPWEKDKATSHHGSLSLAAIYSCSPRPLWSAPDHLRPPHSLLQLHQPLFVLIAFHQHSSHFHPGEALPLGCRHITLTVRIDRSCQLQESREVVYIDCHVKYSHPLHLYFCFSCPPPQVAL